MKTSQIKRSKILHPFLISIFPILILYSQNIGRINTADLVLPLILSIVFSISLYYIVKIILKNSNKSAIIVSIILIILFLFVKDTINNHIILLNQIGPLFHIYI